MEVESKKPIKRSRANFEVDNTVKNNTSFLFVFVEMGQGDCTLVRCPDGSVVIIDCGRSSEGFSERLWFCEAAALLRTPDWCGQKSNKVAAIIFTHGDADHCNMMVNLLRVWDACEITNPDGSKVNIGTLAELSVENSYYSFSSKSPKITKRQYKSAGVWEKYLKNKGVEVNNSSHGKPILNGTDWNVKFVAGGCEKSNTSNFDASTHDNACSIMTLFTVKNKKALICGDATYSTEQYAINTYKNEIANIDLLQIPHHGSKYGSSNDFVKITKPKFAVVSVGFYEHSYRMPEYTSIERYLNLMDKNAPPHNIDYWYWDAKKDKDGNVIGEGPNIHKVWEDHMNNNQLPNQNIVNHKGENKFFYKDVLDETNAAIAIYWTAGYEKVLHREEIDCNLFMTSQSTQIFELCPSGVTKLDLPCLYFCTKDQQVKVDKSGNDSTKKAKS